MAYHRQADLDHAAWQREGAYFSETEAQLLANVRLEAGEKLLEIGCGEGGNLWHLRGRAGARFGIDFSLARARAASKESAGAIVACADATRLPFADESFDVTLVRDLLHHVPTRLDVLTQAYRVTRHGGRLHLFEPNARAPLALLQAATVRAERGVLRSTERRLRDELEATGWKHIELHHAQPFPIERVVLNPRFGLPSFGRYAPVREALLAFTRLAERVVPELAWLYLCFTAVKP
ncbi:MAG: class I SAM-dependent methyltransferase [Polyangia bacterium]